ncbi:hypothetical protein AVEN_81707-1 [Araneus ventricosus]|uniref:Uncharacterized protein n=1 Tax=Araneus ventricosus TaxID=182803 RepID=A0A4Y2IAV2_ARAVE|nr:hypothetical protein AVEN_81707-1 [Araneus ventricosus]
MTRTRPELSPRPPHQKEDFRPTASDFTCNCSTYIFSRIVRSLTTVCLPVNSVSSLYYEAQKASNCAIVREEGEGIQLRLVILTSYFEATRWLFWKEPCHFEPRLDDENDTGAVTPRPPHQKEDFRPTTSDLT